MAGTDLALDPTTHDFVDTPGGDDWAEDATLLPQLQHQLLDERGHCFFDPEAGSLEHTIPRKMDHTSRLRREDARRDALRVFIDLGLAESLELEFSVDRLRVDREAWTGSLVDLQHGQIDLTPLLTYGQE